MWHFSLVSSRNGGLLSHPYLCVCPSVVLPELVSPALAGGPHCWQLWSPTYKQQQSGRRGKPLKSAGKASANAEQPEVVSACGTDGAAACGSRDAVTGWAVPACVQSSLSFTHLK